MENRRTHPWRRRRLLKRVAGATAGAAGTSGFWLQPPTVWRFRGHGPNLLYFAAGAAVAALSVLLVWGLSKLIPWIRRRIQGRRRARRVLQAAAHSETRARALMSELCPHGWRAQITLFGPGDELPADAPDGDRSRVALDWAELEDEARHVAVVRRVWAQSISDALESMVADRRTDETLEQIERGAVSDGTLWPDLG
ncbi:MAG: hypothetical protein ACYDHH_30085 [Solirubrobacteraceae bacterium]